MEHTDRQPSHAPRPAPRDPARAASSRAATRPASGSWRRRSPRSSASARHPVREAIRELEILGMVVSEPFRGARVREVTAQELAESYPVRAAIEEVAARAAFATLHADPSPLEAEIEAMTAAAATGDMHNVLIHDVQFHRVIVEASGNSVLQKTWRSLRVEARTLITHPQGRDRPRTDRRVTRARRRGLPHWRRACRPAKSCARTSSSTPRSPRERAARLVLPARRGRVPPRRRPRHRRGPASTPRRSARGSPSAASRAATSVPARPDAANVQTAEAIRRGMRASAASLEPPRVEHAIRNPDLYVAGHRVEMVSSSAALAAQLPDQVAVRRRARTPSVLRRVLGGRRIASAPGSTTPIRPASAPRTSPVASSPSPAASRIAAAADGLRVRHALRSDASHPAPYVLDHDPGEPEYVEPIELALSASGSATWRFRQTVSRDR